jgi:hypothetical protein
MILGARAAVEILVPCYVERGDYERDEKDVLEIAADLKINDADVPTWPETQLQRARDIVRIGYVTQTIHELAMDLETARGHPLSGQHVRRLLRDNKRDALLAARDAAANRGRLILPETEEFKW